MFDAIEALREAGKATFRPGDVTAHLRTHHMPVGAWEVRGELSNLERLGLIELDEETAVWQLVNGATFAIDAASAVHNGAK